MKKLLFLLSIVLFVCACDPADTSSKKSSDRFPTPSPSVSQPGNVEWGDNSSSSNGFASVSLPSNSNEKNTSSSNINNESSGDKVSSSVISSENKESSNVVNSENKESSSSSSSKEDKPSNILPGEGFGGLH